jgi:hypothetical protein
MNCPVGDYGIGGHKIIEYEHYSEGGEQHVRGDTHGEPGTARVMISVRGGG